MGMRIEVRTLVVFVIVIEIRENLVPTKESFIPGELIGPSHAHHDAAALGLSAEEVVWVDRSKSRMKLGEPSFSAEITNSRLSSGMPADPREWWVSTRCKECVV